MLRVRILGGSVGRDYLYYAESALSCVIPQLMPQIPVYILSEQQFVEICPNKNVEELSDEYLGCYIHDYDPTGLSFSGIPNIKSNSIFLCADRIIRTAELLSKRDSAVYKDTKSLLMSKVLIHEFGHAYMDLFEPIGFTYADPIYEQNEESWANVFTLNTVEAYASSLGCIYNGPTATAKFNKMVLDFIRKQPKEYALGAFVWECGIREYDFWAYNKEKKEIWRTWITNVMSKYNSLSPTTAITPIDRDNMFTYWENVKKAIIK